MQGQFERKVDNGRVLNGQPISGGNQGTAEELDGRIREAEEQDAGEILAKMEAKREGDLQLNRSIEEYPGYAIEAARLEEP